MMRHRKILYALLLGGGLLTTAANPPPETEPPLAPELSGGLGWLNVDKPVSLRDLRGNVVVLDFWTAGCVNCMHMLAVLAALEAKREGQPLQVIGVHSAKFESEKDPTRVLAAVERYGIDHPVVVDRDMAIWERYGVEAWPTLVIIRPDGRVLGGIPGEVSLEQLDGVVGKLLDEGREQGTLAKGPLLPRPHLTRASSLLSFPGKVLVASDGRIFISDTGHHRVLVTSAAGRLLETIGSGEAGGVDGPFATARMVEPQGLALDEAKGRLYIADARGQRVVLADLKSKTIATLAGTGELGRAPLGPETLPAKSVALRTPWDVALRGDTLYVALAGSHQLAAIDLRPGARAATLRRFAGTGREALRDGMPDESAFAQPSGLAIGGDVLYVADSEASAIRAVDLRDGSTKTLLGTGLFDWGDAEGTLRPKMLQHPIAVAVSPGGLWIADTYNRKIKRLVGSPGSQGFDSLRTVVVQAAGTPLGNPSGLSVEPDGSLLIADTDRNRLLRLPLGATEPLVVTVTQRSAPASVVSAPPSTSATRARGEELLAPPQRLHPGRQQLAFQLLAPSGYAFSEGAPWSIDLSAEGDGLRIIEPHRDGEAKGGNQVALEAAVDARGAAVLLASIRATVCDDVNHAACYPRRVRYRVPLAVSGDGDAASGPVALSVTPPAVGTASTR
jgi:sugar lactone lactonase YvrE/thiol-disulfide isomerase/thioredoxin